MNNRAPHDSASASPKTFVDGWPPLEEFIKWSREDPVRAAKWQEAVRRVEAGESGDLTPELRDAAAKYILLRKRHQTMVAVRSNMMQLLRLMKAPAGSFSPERRLPRINRLFAELIDDLLDVPEPHRRRLFGHLMPLRERIKLLERELG